MPQPAGALQRAAENALDFLSKRLRRDRTFQEALRLQLKRSGALVVDVAVHGLQVDLYLPRKERIPEYLQKIVKPNDVVITMGAGDINTVGRELLSRLKLKHEA